MASSANRTAIVAEARSWIGTPYHHQASVKGVGCDCLGLVRGVWRTLYGEEPEAIPPYSRDWAEAGRETLAEAAARHMRWSSPNRMLPGDVLLFALNERAPAKHCAILTEPERMVHSYERHPVAEVSLTLWWRRRIRFVFSFPGC
ncbi:MAG TPA: NlpC/P60 family protein [Xanthobacteraceae bacterium]|nr:NlpC/P60 family protein [Xanthobacteraceae bacterium]